MLAGMFFLGFTSFLSLNAQWAKTYGGSDGDVASAIQQTSDGGYIVAGRTNSFGFVGLGRADIWILKLFPNGDVEWQKTYGGSDDDKAHSIQQTMDGGYIMAGKTHSYVTEEPDFWILKLFPGGEIEWQRTYGGGEWEEARSIHQTNDGGYIVAGGTNVLKLSSEGDIE